MNYIIDFVNSASDAAISAYLTANNCTTIKVYDNFAKVYLVSSNTAPVASELTESIVNDSEHVVRLLGEVVNINRYVNLPNPTLPGITVSTSDPHDWWKNYMLKTPDFAAPTVEFSRKGASGKVYIMDSGIEASHPEFANTQIENLFSFTDEFADTTGHGTAIGSVIAGNTCGLSAAGLKIVKIFDKDRPTLQSDLLSALDAILGDFLQNSSGLGVLNCSWSIPKNAYIEQKIRGLITAGMYVVASAGNSGVPIADVTPASMAEVLTIGSYNKDLKPSNFSNYTNPSVIDFAASEVNTGALDGWAPGEEIWVAALNGTYGYASGTSIAAAIHSCALDYNFGDRMDGSNLSTVDQNQTVSFISNISMGRKNLLDLSDSRYTGSQNRISTIYEKMAMPADYTPSFERTVRVGQTLGALVCNPQNTISVDILTPLPGNAVIKSNGTLVFTPTSVNGTHEVFTSKLRVTLLDNTTVDYDVVIGVLSADFDKASVPTDDPIIPITLAEQSSCYYGGSDLRNGIDNCNDDCYDFGLSHCVEGASSKTTFNCGCG